jgi:tRNA-splicing ligase RtcB (3'-phosphate/5'-hydroxy nucleic acid ligase)
MSESRQAGLKLWLTEPISSEIVKSVDRLRQMDDVQHVALMPDVHLAQDVCIGAVVATRQLIYPAAVGGDIGCGMAALAFDVAATSVDNERAAAHILKGLYEHIPGNKHRKPRDLPAELESLPLSDSHLRRLAQRDGRVQLGTLGRGNHFLEFQSDRDGQLWVLIHSGSRAMGQPITAHHVKNACRSSHGAANLIASDDSGRNYLADVEWARTYARENRLTMLRAVEHMMQQSFAVLADWSSLIHSDHNHVQREAFRRTVLGSPQGCPIGPRR